MPIYGADIHPRYQAGISVEQIRREGLDFLAVKVSEGTGDSFLSAGSADFLRRGKAAGLLCLGYHFLRPGAEAEQARTFAAALRATGVPGMLDAEALDAAGRPTLTIANVRAFLGAIGQYGARVPLLYLPRWYWQRIGSPDLRGLPPLWASRYVAGTGNPRELYTRHHPAGWEPYGGVGVAVLQFSDRARVAGRDIDVNAYPGTRAQFAALIGTAPTTTLSAPPLRRVYPEEGAMDITTDPPDPDTVKKTWPTRRRSVGLRPPGDGTRVLLLLTWSAPGGWVHEAKWWLRPGTGTGTPNQPHAPVPISVGSPERFVGLGWELVAPDRADELEIVLSAPGGCHIHAVYER